MPRSDLESLETPDGTPYESQPAWRKDFPIDWSRAEYRSRREFISFLMLTSAAFVVGQFWIALQAAFRKASSRPASVMIAGVDELPVGGSKSFSYPHQGNACLLVRLGESDFVAFGQKCTHLSCPVLPRPELGQFHCPCHNGWFDIRTGEPLAGPPRRPLPRVGLEIREGKVLANGFVSGSL
jgi:Rieske Fe-S protein